MITRQQSGFVMKSRHKAFIAPNRLSALESQAYGRLSKSGKTVKSIRPYFAGLMRKRAVVNMRGSKAGPNGLLLGQCGKRSVAVAYGGFQYAILRRVRLQLEHGTIQGIAIPRQQEAHGCFAPRIGRQVRARSRMGHTRRHADKPRGEAHDNSRRFVFSMRWHRGTIDTPCSALNFSLKKISNGQRL